MFSFVLILKDKTINETSFIHIFCMRTQLFRKIDRNYKKNKYTININLKRDSDFCVIIKVFNGFLYADTGV